MAEKKKESGIWGLFDRFEGDKVILMIVLLLVMFSVVSIFSSTPLLALETGKDRLSIVKEQLIIAGGGLLLIAICYLIRNIRFYRACARCGFWFSFILLFILVTGIKLPFVQAASVNGAQRILKVMGLQVHVYEVVKVAMVMYLAWAVEQLKGNGFALAKRLARENKMFDFLEKEIWLKVIYIYLPILIVTLMVMRGSNSSAIFVAATMVVTIFVGGVGYKDVFLFGAGVTVIFVLIFGLYKIGVVPEGGRLGTAISRLTNDDDDTMETLIKSKPNTVEYNDARDKLKQPVGALIAIQEGGVGGKGPGGSTQRYVVPVMFGDYMYSFIIEEYGLIGGIIFIILYVSLLARGALLARNCDSWFAKTAVAGLIVLISGQAFMHMMVNVHLIPQTGQTLPLVSHGSSSFLVFSLAFGIVLSISRMAHRKLEKQAKAMGPILERDEVRSSLNDLEALDSGDPLNEDNIDLE